MKKITLREILLSSALFLSVFSASLYAIDELIYIDESQLEAVNEQVNNYHFYFYNAYLDLIDAADDEMTEAVNPVTNKTQTPPSGDMHDYLSLAPYWWPNPDTDDGLPWIRKDGQVNPETRGDHTDQVRSSAMFSSVETLALAYYFSGNQRYADKAYQHIHAWFIDEATKMNPNINYGQAVPGSVEGRPAGIIEFVGVGNLITALQILERDSILSQAEVLTMKQWMSDMVTWLTTHEYALAENDSEANHGTWYDYQVLGMYMYLGDTAKAIAKAESIKTRRIAVQIEPNGAQPEELGRTKSVNYSNMNLWGMTRLCVLAKKVGVDLWAYETSDGRSIRRAYEFLVPYIMQTQTWTWQQIISGGATAAIPKYFLPTFAKASGVFQETLLPLAKSGSYDLSYIDKLCFPPLEMMPEDERFAVNFAYPSQDTVVSVSDLPSSYQLDVTLDGVAADSVKTWMTLDGIALRTSAGKRQVWQGTTITHEALSNLEAGSYELKAVAQAADGRLAENYLKLTVQPSSSSYSGTPLSLPGVLEAEDYDLGGEGIAYHDSDAKNMVGAYRSDGVDIVQFGDVVAVTETDTSEWLNYSVLVDKAAYYDFEFTYYGMTLGRLSAQWAEADTALFSAFELPASSSSEFASTTQAHVYLAAGRHQLRLNFESSGFHLDKISIAASATAALSATSANALKIYPNPTTGRVFLPQHGAWELFSISGESLQRAYGKVIDLSQRPVGIYLIKTEAGPARVIKL